MIADQKSLYPEGREITEQELQAANEEYRRDRSRRRWGNSLAITAIITAFAAVLLPVVPKTYFTDAYVVESARQTQNFDGSYTVHAYNISETLEGAALSGISGGDFRTPKKVHFGNVIETEYRGLRSLFAAGYCHLTESPRTFWDWTRKPKNTVYDSQEAYEESRE